MPVPLLLAVRRKRAGRYGALRGLRLERDCCRLPRLPRPTWRERTMSDHEHTWEPVQGEMGQYTCACGVSGYRRAVFRHMKGPPIVEHKKQKGPRQPKPTVYSRTLLAEERDLRLASGGQPKKDED